MKLYLATYESRNFTFEGVGASEAEARDVLKQGLRAHAAEYRLPDEWWQPLPVDLDFEEWSEEDLFPVRTFERGTAYRDREILPAGIVVDVTNE